MPFRLNILDLFLFKLRELENIFVFSWMNYSQENIFIGSTEFFEKSDAITEHVSVVYQGKKYANRYD